MELFYILLVLLLATRICGELAERLRQPALVGELIAGIAIGSLVAHFGGAFPVLSGLVDDEVFLAITDLGIFFLMLHGGIEIKPREIAESSRAAVLIASGGFFLPLAAGFGLAWYFLPSSDLKVAQSLFVGTALAITAVPVAIRILLDLGRLKSRIGQMIVSAALVDDVLSLVLLAVLLAVIRSGALPDLASLAFIVGKIVLFFAITVGIGWYIVPRLAKLVGRARVAEFEFSALLICALGYAYLAELLDLHFILGAFIAGLFFNRRIMDERIYEGVKLKISGVTSGFLAPLFFASIGLHLDVSAVTEIPLFLLALIVTALLAKLVGAGVPALLTGMSRRKSLAVGCAMSGRGAVELIIADIALRGGIFSTPDPPPPEIANLFSAIVIVAIVTTLATPLMLRRILGSS